MATNSDGSVVIGVDMSITKAEKQLQKLTDKIAETEQKLSELYTERDKAKQKGILDSATLDAEKAKLEEMKKQLQEIKAVAKDKTLSPNVREEAKADILQLQAEISDQKERVRGLQAEWNKTEKSVEKYNDQIQKAEAALEKQKADAGELAESIAEANSISGRFSTAMHETEKSVEKLGTRLKKLASRVLVFSVFTTALRSAREWLGNVVKSNDEASQAVARLKGALLTLIQPLVEVIIPAFTNFVNVLTNIVAVAANLISSLFGSTVEGSADAAEGLYNEQQAISGVGDAAKKAGKSMASFDEINKLSSSDSSGSSSTSSETEIAPDFSFMDSVASGLAERLAEISGLVLGIGIGFGLWKLSENLPGKLGDLLGKLALVAVAIGAIKLALDGLSDAWENGVDWVNMAEMIGGVAIAGWALYAAFGGIVGGITFLVGGIAMLVTAFHDAMENGLNLKNTLLAVAGLFSSGLGISLLLSSPIPLLIAAIASILLAITVATGRGEELIGGMRKTLEGFADFFKGIFSGDLELTIEGIKEIFAGWEESVTAVVDGIKDFFLAFLDWLDEKTGGKFHNIIEAAKIIVTNAIESWKDGFRVAIDALKLFFTGLVDFVSGALSLDFDRALKGIAEIFEGAARLISAPFVTLFNFIIDGINAVINALNNVHFEIPDWVPVFGGKRWDGLDLKPLDRVEIPRLATGAVIPPNREFMAVLGDQTSGMNIETPENLLRQIVREENGDYTSILREILQAIKDGKIMMVDNNVFAQVVKDANERESNRQGVPLVTMR